MDNSKDAAVRARAYQLWVESGYADGYHDIHWRQAEREIAERDVGGQEAQPEPARPAGEPGPHSDGMSRHPSVLDPGPSTSRG